MGKIQFNIIPNNWIVLSFIEAPRMRGLIYDFYLDYARGAQSNVARNRLYVYI